MLTRRTLAAAGLTLASARLHAAALLETPPGACDCHGHIIGPPDRYLMVAGCAYIPPQSTVAQLLVPRQRLDALGQLDNTARGIAVLDPDIPDAALASLDRAGIRGVRVNIEGGGGRGSRAITGALGVVSHLETAGLC